MCFLELLSVCKPLNFTQLTVLTFIDDVFNLIIFKSVLCVCDWGWWLAVYSCYWCVIAALEIFLSCTNKIEKSSTKLNHNKKKLLKESVDSSTDPQLLQSLHAHIQFYHLFMLSVLCIPLLLSKLFLHIQQQRYQATKDWKTSWPFLLRQLRKKKLPPLNSPPCSENKQTWGLSRLQGEWMVVKLPIIPRHHVELMGDMRA